MATAQRQKLPLKEKTPEWGKANVEYYKNLCYPNNGYLQSLYKAANGELEFTDYGYMVNPFGNAVKNRPELQSYPAKLRNYPIIPAIIKDLIGEKRDRPILSYVTLLNSDVITRKKAEEVRLLKQSIQQTYINELNAAGIDTGQESVPQDPLDVLMQQFDAAYKDVRAILGQEVLDYILMDCDIHENFIQGFKDWVITSCVYTLKDVVDEDVIHRILSPERVGWVGDMTQQYVEDCEAAAVVESITRATFLDRHWNTVQKEGAVGAEEILEIVDNPVQRDRDGRVLIYGYSDLIDGNVSGMNSNFVVNNYPEWFTETMELAYVNWTSWQFVREVAFQNNLGEIEILEVPEDYKVQEEFGEVVIRSYWGKQIWEGYCLQDKMYFGVRAIPIQRNKINNKASAKLLINGKIKRMGNRKELSIVELLMPFQHLYNFAHYKTNNLLAKNKDKLLVLPIGLMPDHEGWDMYTSMYHADATSILWVDESKDETRTALNNIREIDLSLGQYIASMFEYMREIKTQAEAVVGFNPQRMGQTSADVGLGVSNAAIRRTSVITEDLFAEYDKFQERELNGLLDISRFAYLNGKKAAYINSLGREVFLSVDAENTDFVNSEFQVFVVNSSKEKEKFNKMVGFAETLASQGGKGSTLATILNAESNFAKLETKLQQIEAQEAAMMEQSNEANRQSQQQIAQIAADTEQKKLDFEYWKISTQEETKMNVKLIDADVKTMGMDANMNAIPDNVEIEKNAISREKTLTDAGLKSREISLKEQEINNKKEEVKLKADSEKYKADTALKIARENKTAAELKARQAKKGKKG